MFRHSSEFELHPAGHAQPGEHAERAFWEAEELQPLEPARDLAGQFARDLRASEIEMPKVFELLELEQALVGE